MSLSFSFKDTLRTAKQNLWALGASAMLLAGLGSADAQAQQTPNTQFGDRIEYIRGTRVIKRTHVRTHLPSVDGNKRSNVVKGRTLVTFSAGGHYVKNTADLTQDQLTFQTQADIILDGNLGPGLKMGGFAGYEFIYYTNTINQSYPGSVRNPLSGGIIIGSSVHRQIAGAYAGLQLVNQSDRNAKTSHSFALQLKAPLYHLNRDGLTLGVAADIQHNFIPKNKKTNSDPFFYIGARTAIRFGENRKEIYEYNSSTRTYYPTEKFAPPQLNVQGDVSAYIGIKL